MGNIVSVKLNRPNQTQNFVARATYALEPTKISKSIVTNLMVTHQELDCLFGTAKYTRPYQPEYYNPLEDLIGELWTEDIIDLAIGPIIDKISQFIPYIVVDQANTSFGFNNHKLYMSLVFYYDYDFDKILYNYEREFDMVT